MEKKLIKLIDKYIEENGKDWVTIQVANNLAKNSNLNPDNISNLTGLLIKEGKLPHAIKLSGGKSNFVIPHSNQEIALKNKIIICQHCKSEILRKSAYIKKEYVRCNKCSYYTINPFFKGKRTQNYGLYLDNVTHWEKMTSDDTEIIDSSIIRKQKINRLYGILNGLFLGFILISIVILCWFFLKSYYKVINLEQPYKILLTLALVSPFLIFAVTISPNFRQGEKKRGSYSRILTNYLAILLFFSTGIAAFEYLKKEKNKLPVPDIRTGSVGFRAWNAEVILFDMEIAYQDTNKKWQKIPYDIVNCYGSWKGPIKPNKKANCKMIKDSVTYKDNKYFAFILDNCGIQFSHKEYKDIFHAKNIRLKSRIIFVDTLNGENTNSGFNLIFRYDTLLYQYKSETCIIKDKYGGTADSSYSNDDPCIEFAFPFNDDPHLWIPGLEWQPGTLRSSNADDYERVKNIKIKRLNEEYTLSAFIFDRNLSFTAVNDNYGGSSVLFEAQMDPTN